MKGDGDMALQNFIELSKISKKLKTPKDIWVAFIGAKSEEELDMLAKQEPIIQNAIGRQAYFSADEKLRRELQVQEDAEREYWSGMAQSRREGKIEGKIETAKKMLERNMPIEDICDITGLSEEEIQRIK